MASDQTGLRKDDHLRINFEEDVSFDVLTTGFEFYRFVHQALPEIDMDEVDTTTTFLGCRLALPLLIGSATGGTPRAGRINQMLAETAQEAGIGMGLGSMRAALEDSGTRWTFQVRRYAPNILLLANLGAVQLNYNYGPDDCQRIVDMVEADGLYLHLNPLQEALQPEGNTRFSGLLRRIEAVCKALRVPLIVKEVGWGLSKQAAQQLIGAGVAALDVAGAGGTSWSQVEMHRSKDPMQREVAATFRDWGIPTATALRIVREVAPDIPLIASGGLRTGLEIAKALALGADLTAIAGPFIKAVDTSPQALRDHIESIRRQFRIAMFATAARDIPTLKQTSLTHVGKKFLVSSF